MFTETTVLLLEAESLPSSLEEQLSKRDVFVEHASASDVAQMLPVIAPDLLVQPGSLDISATVEALQNEKNGVPLVIIADRTRIRELTENHGEAILALIPQDLPIAAIAHRLATLARQSVEGNSLSGEKGPQAEVSAQAPTTVTKPAPRGGPSPERKSTRPGAPRGSLAPAPLAPHQQVKIVDPQDALQREAEQAAREEAALREAEAQERAVLEAREKSKLEAEERNKKAAEKRRLELEQQARERSGKLEERRKEQALRLEERKREQDQKRELRRQELERRSKERASIRVEAKRTSQRPLPNQNSPNQNSPNRNTPSEVKALDDLFPTSAPEPATPEPEPATTRSSSPPGHARLLDRSAELDLEQTTQAVDISAFAQDLDKKARGERDHSSAEPPRAVAQEGQKAGGPSSSRGAGAGFSAVRKVDELSVIMPLPVDMRVDLAPQSGLRPVRLALLDTDLTRADAMSRELRERGMKIHPVTPDPGRTRWPMLRRFAPQGLVVDEKSMARGAAEWVETFRGDPFLRHVPVILVRFSRVFEEATGKISLDPLLQMIEHVGREEFALLEKLGPGRRVDLMLSQVTPFRLVEMLTKEDRNTRLDCKSDTERMVWHLGPGYAGRGKLADLRTDAPKQRLSPSEALTWLLGHDDCHVAVQEHGEPLAHASESVDAEGLLREMTEALGAPVRHESVRPGALSQKPRPSTLPGPPPPPAPREVAGASVNAAPPFASTETSQVAPPAREGDRLSELEVELPLGRRPLLSPETKEKFVAQAQSAWVFLRRGYALYESRVLARLSPLEPKVPNAVLRHVPWAMPLLLVVLLILLVSLSGGSDDSTAEADALSGPSAGQLAKAAAPSAASEKLTPPTPPSPGEGKEKSEDEDSLWTVVTSDKLPSCEERLGASAPKKVDPVRSSGYLKAARKQLMLGDTEEAIQNLCLAGLSDPGGQASEGLAEYYLGQRAVEQAERWIRESLKADPERRKSMELLGDIENQKGNVKEAKKILLRTLQLSGDETKTMELTARKLRQDSRLARKGGDLPRAERELRRAALLSPKDAEIAAELGDILLRREASVTAARWAAHSLKLDPNYSTAMLLAARIAEAQGKKEKAREFYEMVPLGDPNHDEAQRRRGRL